MTWEKSSSEQADAYEDLFRRKAELLQQGKRSTVTHDEEDAEEEEEGLETLGRMSTIVPSYSTSASIEPLSPASVFLVEVSQLGKSSVLQNFLL